MSRHCLDVEADGCGLSAKALRSDAEFVDFLQHFFFQICVERIRVLRIDRAHQCFFRKQCTFIEGSADTNADYHRRAWVRACCLNNFQDEILDSLKTCGRFEHTDHTHIFASEAFRAYGNFDLLARNDLGVEHSRCIVAGVSSSDRIFDNGFS